MVDAAVTLANAQRASMELSAGLSRVAKDIPQPLAGIFDKMLLDIDAGRTLMDVLQATQQRLQLDSVSLFATAVLAADAAGGPLGKTLDEIVRSLQENYRLQGKLDAQTASGRMVVKALVCVPFIFLALGYAVFPEGTGLVFSTWTGQGALLIVMLGVAAGVFWAARILSSASAV